MKSTMKKVLGTLLAFALVVTLAACGGNDKKDQSSAASEASSNVAASEESKADASSEAATKGGDVDPSLKGQISASGSSALKPLADKAAEAFMQKATGVAITVNAGGSGQGLKDVATGTVTLGMSDVFAEDKLEADQAKGLVDHKVCIITMAPIVNEKNKVADLTQQQMIDIFTGKVTNWKDVGGDDKPIMLITRPSSSGTRALFTKFALNGADETKGSMETDNSGELLQSVKQNEGAIGYVALSYLVGDQAKGVKAVKLDGVEPTLENTYSGKYPVWGFEHVYTKGEAQTPAKEFLDYFMGEEFGKNIEEMGYGVSSKLAADAVKGHDTPMK